MPPYEEDVPRLAEIARTLTDFRNEFREALTAMVRRDVYAAEMRALEQKFVTATEALEMKIAQAMNENKRLSSEISGDRDDRKSIRNAFIGAVAVAAVALLVSIVKAFG